MKNRESTIAHMYLAVNASPSPISVRSKKIGELAAIGFAHRLEWFVHVLHHPLAVLARVADERVVLATTFGHTRHQEFEREVPGEDGREHDREQR